MALMGTRLLAAWLLGRRTALVAASIGLVVGCGQQIGTENRAGTDLPERPDTVAEGGRPVGCIFDSLPALVATSDVVVFGTVESAQPGRVMRHEPFPSSDPEVEDGTPIDILVPVRWRELAVQVEEQFFGEQVGSTIVEQDGYQGELAFECASTPWLFAGDRAVFFAQENVEAGRYRIMLAGEWVVEPDGSVSTWDDTDPILVEIDGMP